MTDYQGEISMGAYGRRNKFMAKESHSSVLKL